MKPITSFRKGVITAITLLCLYLVFPSFQYYLALRGTPPADETEKKAWEENLETMRKSAIPLGLDLRGGVDVSLMIDEQEAVKGAVSSLSATLKNEFADKKISAAVGVSADGMQITLKALDKADARNIANVLANYASQIDGDYSQAKLETGDELLLDLNRQAIDLNQRHNIEGALKVVRDRLDKFGLTQPSISIQGGNRIRVQVAGEKNPDSLVASLTAITKMEFRLAHPMYGTPSDPINQLLDEKGEVKPDAVVPLGYEILPYKFGRVDSKTDKVVYTTGKMLVERVAQMTGEELRNTGVQQDPMDLNHPIKITLQFKDKGTEAFAKMTTESSERYKQEGQANHLAIILDGEVISSPQMAVPITGGNAVIEGGFKLADAQDLSQRLKGGSLPAPLKVESKRTVGASLGTESIFGGVRALAVGTIVVIIFMIAYYGTAGVIAIIALILNILITLAIMALAGATLTLSGIGGILLTVGMAVDSNVLIYERMREELANGKSLKQAIAYGYDRAFAVIFDSHMTTLLTALVLLQFTEGSVFGFALTMTFGIVANLYTGLTVTYTLCAIWFQWKNSLGLGKLRIFANASYDFIKLRYISVSGSIIMLLIGLGTVVMHGGLNMGVDFEGGVLAEVSFKQPTQESELRAMTQAAGLEGERLQNVSGSNVFIIRVKAKHVNGNPDAQATEQILRDSLEKAYPGDQHEIRTISNFGPETTGEFAGMALSVTFLSCTAILAYLWFQLGFVFGLAAVIAVLHDLIITATWSSLWGVEITLDVVASLMVLLGFSVNDTIVIFDRIRETTKRNPNMSFGEICNRSMNETLSRTIITSGTVFMVVTVMLIMGGEGLQPFAKIMFIGSLVGSYSTDFVAAPMLYWWNNRTNNSIVNMLTAKAPTGPEIARDPGAAKAGMGSLPRSRAV